MALIYIVEDDDSIREIESIALSNSGHTVSTFARAGDFHRRVEEKKPDLVILDIMLPDEDGYETLKKLRTNPLTEWIPVIMVTAKTTEMDMIRGLENGADDYIRKPFSVMELITRVKALLRRTEPRESAELKIGSIVMDQSHHTVTVNDRQVELTYKEYELLRYLMMNPNVVLSRDAIMREVWGFDFEGESRTVDMHIKTLRQKLGEESSRIRTVRNVGYSIEDRGEV